MLLYNFLRRVLLFLCMLYSVKTQLYKDDLAIFYFLESELSFMAHNCFLDTVPTRKSYTSSFSEWVNRMMLHSTCV